MWSHATDIVAFQEYFVFAIFADFGHEQTSAVLCRHGLDNGLGCAVAEHQHSGQAVLVCLWVQEWCQGKGSGRIACR